MTKINIGGFELDSTKLPEKGLDYSKFDEATKNLLSVFNTDNNKGHLSKAELQKAISFFASHDGLVEKNEDEDGLSIKYHKKDSKIDSVEYNKTLEDYNDKLSNTQTMKQIEEAGAVAAKKAISEFIEDYKHKKGKFPSDEEIATATKTAYWLEGYNVKKKKEKAIDKSNSSVQKTLNVIYMTIEANKKGLTPTDTAGNIFKDEKGNYFTYNFFTKDFRISSRIGHHNVWSEATKEGDRFVIRYDKNGDIIYLKAVNKDNKAYLNEKKSLEVIIRYNHDKHYTRGYGKIDDNDVYMIRAFHENGKDYYELQGYSKELVRWDEEKHAFIQEALNQDK